MNKVVITLALLLIVATGYIGTEYVGDKLNERDQGVYQLGIDQTLVTIYNTAYANGYVELNVGNETMVLINYVPQNSTEVKE